ncbi:MAG: Xaa-Pro peptidase family protein [Solirubrobacteraceae bacterium]|nr:Xaa-Pro peptidase family protein [Solirubrobacteraceae bacterium]
MAVPPPADRADRLAALLAEERLDALVVTDLHDVRWLTGFTGSNGAAVVGADGTRRFLTDFRYLEQVRTQVPDPWERIDGGRDLGGAGVAANLPREAVRVGFDDADVTVAAHRRLRDAVRDGVELVPAPGLVRRLRQVKEPAERDAIRAACELASTAFVTVILEGPVVGRTERQVALDLVHEMQRLGASDASFPPIIAAGAHGALPHAEPRDVEIPVGALLTVDWGCVLDGYCSDCTRTVATGPLDADARRVYDVVLDAQLQALAAVRSGADVRAVDAVARDVIGDAGHREHFGHGLGHGVGLEVHEGPTLSPRGSGALRAGEIVTVEPGIYVPGRHGVRIEDLAAVTDDGPDVFTGTVTKELVEL